MGQGLYAPPSVAGWDGGPAWINTTTMLARTNFVLALLSARTTPLGERLDPTALAAQARRRRAGEASPVLRRPARPGRLRPRRSATAARVGRRATAEEAGGDSVLTSPEYQL